MGLSDFPIIHWDDINVESVLNSKHTGNINVDNGNSNSNDNGNGSVDQNKNLDTFNTAEYLNFLNEATDPNNDNKLHTFNNINHDDLLNLNLMNLPTADIISNNDIIPNNLSTSHDNTNTTTNTTNNTTTTNSNNEFTPLLSPTVPSNKNINLRNNSVTSINNNKLNNASKFTPLSSPIIQFKQPPPNNLRQLKRTDSNIDDNDNDNDSNFNNSNNSNNPNTNSISNSNSNSNSNSGNKQPNKKSKTPSSTPKMIPNDPKFNIPSYKPNRHYSSSSLIYNNSNSNSNSNNSNSNNNTPNNSVPKKNNLLLNPNHHKSSNSSPVILPSSSNNNLFIPNFQIDRKSSKTRNNSISSSACSTPSFKSNDLNNIDLNDNVGGIGTNILSLTSSNTSTGTSTGTSTINNNSGNYKDKKTSHKLAEQGRRNRMNYAVQQLDKLIPERMKLDITVPSKATTVELGCQYINELLAEIDSLKKS